MNCATTNAFFVNENLLFRNGISKKTENEISVECSVSRLLDSPDNKDDKDDNISEIEEKGSSSLGGQVVKKNFGDYFRQIQDFIRRNLKWK